MVELYQYLQVFMLQMTYIYHPSIVTLNEIHYFIQNFMPYKIMYVSTFDPQILRTSQVPRKMRLPER